MVGAAIGVDTIGTTRRLTSRTIGTFAALAVVTDLTVFAGVVASAAVFGVFLGIDASITALGGAVVALYIHGLLGCLCHASGTDGKILRISLQP